MEGLKNWFDYLYHSDIHLFNIPDKARLIQNTRRMSDISESDSWYRVWGQAPENDMWWLSGQKTRLSSLGKNNSPLVAQNGVHGLSKRTWEAH